jgi:anti-sigma factor RsiW
MSSICPILRGSFEDYRRDALPAPQRRILRDHLAACPECRDLAASEDPTMLFARPFAAEEVPAEDAQRMLANVRTAVAFAQTERRLRSTSRRRIAGAAAAAAAFGALLLTAPGRETGRVETLQVAAVEEAAPTPAAVESEPAVPSTDFVPEIEGVSNDATVYEWSPGAGREEPRVVWIVDRGLDI